MLFVSHDRYFINELANKIISVRDGHAKIYNGNYSYYLDEKAKQAAAAQEAEAQKAEMSIEHFEKAMIEAGYKLPANV